MAYEMATAIIGASAVMVTGILKFVPPKNGSAAGTSKVDTQVCTERHRHIDEKFSEIKEHLREIDRNIKGIPAEVLTLVKGDGHDTGH